MLKTKEVAIGVFLGGLVLAVVVWFYMTVSALSAQVQLNTQNIQALANYINQSAQPK